MAAGLLLATAAPSSAASYQYWSGYAGNWVVKSSGSYTSGGGNTRVDGTGLTAHNASAQYGYSYAVASANLTVTLTHGPRPQTTNWSYFSFGTATGLPGTARFHGTVHY